MVREGAAEQRKQKEEERQKEGYNKMFPGPSEGFALTERKDSVQTTFKEAVARKKGESVCGLSYKQNASTVHSPTSMWSTHKHSLIVYPAQWKIQKRDFSLRRSGQRHPSPASSPPPSSAGHHLLPRKQGRHHMLHSQNLCLFIWSPGVPLEQTRLLQQALLLPREIKALRAFWWAILLSTA